MLTKGFAATRRLGWLLLLIPLLLSGCGAATTVAVSVQPDGSGRVTVSVVVDAAAKAAMGGVASKLDTAGLASAGWQVAPVTTAKDGSVTLSASHSFTKLDQIQSILSEVARTQTHGDLFRLTLKFPTHTFWTTKTEASGTVDLSCGLACFGDAGLRQSYGSEVGVNTAPLGGFRAAQKDLTFKLTLDLPGQVLASNGVHSGSRVTWSVPLGVKEQLTASAKMTNGKHVTELVGAGGLLLVVLIVAIFLILTTLERFARLRRFIPVLGRGHRAAHKAGRHVPLHAAPPSKGRHSGGREASPNAEGATDKAATDKDGAGSGSDDSTRIGKHHKPAHAKD